MRKCRLHNEATRHSLPEEAYKRAEYRVLEMSDQFQSAGSSMKLHTDSNSNTTWYLVSPAPIIKRDSADGTQN